MERLTNTVIQRLQEAPQSENENYKYLVAWEGPLTKDNQSAVLVPQKTQS